MGELVVGRQVPPTKPRNLTAKLLPPIKPRPLPDIDRLLPTEHVDVVAKVLSAQFMVDRLLSTELAIDRPLPVVNRLLSAELVVAKVPSAELILDRPPSAVAPIVNCMVAYRATPIYGRLSSDETGATKYRGVRV